MRERTTIEISEMSDEAFEAYLRELLPEEPPENVAGYARDPEYRRTFLEIMSSEDTAWEVVDNRGLN